MIRTIGLKRPFGDISRQDSSHQLPPSIQAKVETALESAARNSSNNLKNTFIVIEDEKGTPAYLLEENSRKVQKIGKKLGKGGVAGGVYNVKTPSQESLALKIAQTTQNPEGSITYHDLDLLESECKIIGEILPKINPDGTVRGLPKPIENPLVYSNLGNKKKLVGFLMEKGGDDYQKHSELHKDSLFFQQIGEEFKDIAHGLAKLHETHMHGDLKPHNIVAFGEGKAKIIDFGKTRELATLWNRIDDDFHCIHSYVPQEDDNRFKDLPALIELDTLEPLNRAKRKLKKAKKNQELDKITKLKQKVTTLNTQLTELKDECPMLGKSMDIFGAGIAFFRRCYGTQPYEHISPLSNAKVFEKDANNNLIPLKPRQFSEVPLPNGLKELMEEMLHPHAKERPSALQVIKKLEEIFPEDSTSSNPK